MSLFNAATRAKTSLADSEIDITIKTAGATKRSVRKRATNTTAKSGSTAPQRKAKKRSAGSSQGSGKAQSNCKKARSKQARTSKAHDTTHSQPKRVHHAKTVHQPKPVQQKKHVHQPKPGHHPKSDQRASSGSHVHTGSLFRINRAPLASYGRKTFLSDRENLACSTNVNEPLADRTPTPEEIAFVKTLNRKFKRLENLLGAQFRAYCGGSSGFVVRRYTLSCSAPTEDILAANKPIGMGPKGLDKYFMKHYKVSWDYFLKTPSEVLELKIVKGEAKPPSSKRRKKKEEAASKQKSTSSAVRAKKRTPLKVAPTETAARPAEKTSKRTPPSSARPKPSAAPTVDYDKTEREMNELKRLLQQSIK